MAINEKIHTIQDLQLPKGIHRSWNLPDSRLDAMWDSIIVEDSLKTQLLSQAMLNFTVRGRVDRSVLPLHGVILLVGPPGTGKTSLARGLANRVSRSFKAGGFQLLEVEPHSLTSSAMGKTQKAVSDLFSQSISEASIGKPTIILLDEVETLAVDRSKLSLDANPIDIHRATDAVLVQLDMLAEQNPNLLFIATSNFPEAVDSAFISRCDLIIEVPMPNRDVCKLILKDCLEGLKDAYPEIPKLCSSSKFDECVKECVGLDGRTIRKMVANALASSPETAINPNKVKIENLIDAAKAAKLNRGRKA